jgi:ketosteroid isomerase-like protein
MTQATVEFASETVRSETLALDAIERFYEALNRTFAGDLGPMEGLWAQTPDVVLKGPFGGRQVGWPELRRVVERDSKLKRGGQILPRDLVVRVGKDLAYGVCIERGEITTNKGERVPLDLRATNILKREGDDWRFIYHHTDPLPAMQEASGLKLDAIETPEGPPPDPTVLKVLDRFYGAIRSMFGGDLEPLADIWSHTDDVSFASPVGNIQVGWEAVRAEFERHAKVGIKGNLEYKEPFVRVCGDLAYASCLATAPDMTINGKPYDFNLRATTIFRREDGQWRVVHHHSDCGPGLPELCGETPK